MGRTPATFDVSASGEAQYHIPISVPAGTNGLTPALSLSYSHASGGGIAGTGWNLGGLSAIQRCVSTVAQDGVARGVRNDLLDRFCLDGQKLRLAAGSYGVAGSTYRTEIERFARITAHGTAGNGPAHFVLEGLDGLLYEYGNSTDSRIESAGQGTVRAWALNTVRDRSGNAVTFSYAEDAVNGSYRLDLVSYGGNLVAGTAATHSIDLVYENRPGGEVEHAYLGGSVIRETRRLDRIDVTHAGGILVRRYELTYEPALSNSGRSRLASVQECAGSSLDCLSPTLFAYHDGVPLGVEQSTGSSVPVGGFPMDVNGDGREDLVYPSSATSGAGHWMVMFANASGTYNAPVNTGILNTNYSGAITIDYNRDGRRDLLVPYSGNTWWVMLGTTSGLAAPSNTGAPATTTGRGTNARALDVDGDGLEDLVWADLVGYAGGDAIRYRQRLAGGAFSSTVNVLVGPLAVNRAIGSGMFASWDTRMPTRRPDFNGDGRDDIVYRHTRRLPGEPGVPDKFIYTIQVLCPGVTTFASWSATATAGPEFADFNGDGLTDIFHYDQTGTFRYALSTGTGFAPLQSAGSIAPYLDARVLLDWDGDGNDDVLLAHATSGLWYLMRSTGEALSSGVSTGLPYVGSAVVTDLNGDHQPDLAYRDGSGLWRYRTREVLHTYPDLLATAVDGFGVAATFAYQPISNSSIYTRGTGTTFPDVDLEAPLWVVSTLSATDGTGYDSTYSLQFSYEGARRNTQGRGFLGFAKRTVIDDRLGYNLRTLESYRHDFPYIGAPQSVERQKAGGARISLTTLTWQNLSAGTGYEIRRYPYVATSVTDDHEIEGPMSGTKFRSTTRVVATIDATSGVVTDATTTTTEHATGLFPGSYLTERIHHPSILNDQTHWCLGHPTATQVTRSHTMAQGGAITRSEDATWNGAQCRLDQRRIEPGHPSLQVTIGLAYDTFGNVSSETVTGIGMTPRTTSYGWGSDGRHLRSVTNPLSQTTAQDWNGALGRPIALTDPNNLTTSWDYDAFGRRTVEIRPDATSTTWAYLACPSGCDPRVRYLVQQQQRSTGNVVFNTTTHYFNRWDVLGWERRQQLGGTYAYATVREFDARGRITREYVPFAAGSSSNGSRHWSYDLLDRPTADALHTPAGVVMRSMTHAYTGLTQSQTDLLNHTGTQVRAAWGDRVRIVDAAAGAANFQYDAFGQLKQASDPAGNVVSSVTYNVRGMRTQLVDMGLGSWSFTPNALGEVVSQTDAKAQTTNFTFDALGRLTSRTNAEGTSNWTWGTSSAARNIGRLQSLGGPGYGESYLYDSAGRMNRRTVVSDATYQFDFAYNDLGLLHSLTYPTSTAGVRYKVKYLYDYGHLSQVREFTNDVDGVNLWSLNLMDPAGRPISEAYGNGLWLQSTFDPLTGEMKERRSGTGGSDSNVQNLRYVWDAVGNLSNRQDLRQGLTESFSYDSLDRLTQASGAGGTLTMTYDAIGNLMSRSDVGSYTYHATKRHAVIAAGANSYSYDANGNMITRNGASVGWRSDNLPSVINAAGYSAQFDYGPDGQRWRQVSSYASGNETTIYVAGLLEKLTTPVRTHWKHLIPTPSGQVQHLRRSDGTSETLYLPTEHLGSVDAVLDAGGAVLARPSFTAWGARRSSSWSGAPSSGEWQAIANTNRRGYTGHEQLDNVMLVHMNGRVYDPAIGRFLSADPYIDCEQDTQGWNRYSYVKGGVLRYTDPSGYKADDLLDPTRAIAPNDVNPGLPIDPATGLETLTVTGTRLIPLASAGVGYRSTPAPGPGGGGRQGRDPKKDEKEDCMKDCMRYGNAAATIAGSTAAGAIAGGQVGGGGGAIAGGLAGLAGGALMATVSDNSYGVSISVAAGGGGAAAASAVSGVRGTQALGQIAGGMYAGLASGAGMPAPLSSLSGGLISGIGSQGRLIGRNVRIGGMQGGAAGFAGYGAELLTRMGAEKVCEFVCEQ